ncbi:ESPR domain-containing protein [Moraxella haemolytica]|uniref:ESPR domain-containing protein n=1 Tax=Moraxella haemolytica TaxID=2904119 RepID=UPI0025432816|nr:ESPR domain-containing protein [Moraxella sp. ZY171148]WII95177.1 ESPR domain-containing protein [Moraxella sp. ZY171148]
MNKVYKVIFNRTTQVFQAVSELARGHQRTQTGSTSLSKDPTQSSSFHLNPIASAIDSLKPAVRSFALTTLLLSGLSFSGSVSAQFWEGRNEGSENLVWGGASCNQ